jgi:hypothetical protein
VIVRTGEVGWGAGAAAATPARRRANAARRRIEVGRRRLRIDANDTMPKNR